MKTRAKKPAKTPNAFNFRMPPPMRSRLDSLAARHGLKPADLVRNALWTSLPNWEANGIIILPVSAN